MDALWFMAGVAVVVVVFVALRQRGLVRAGEARRLLREGARVIDVRTPREFAAGHLPQAVNIPLDDLAERIGKVVPELETPLLLHWGARRSKARGTRRGGPKENVRHRGGMENAA